jgi:hypothetical protein
MKSIQWHVVDGAAIGIMMLTLCSTQWVGCDGSHSTPVAPQVENEIEHSEGSRPQLAVAGLPNLHIEGISHVAYRGADGKYSVVFYVTVCNRGTATAWGFVAGMKGWGTPTISTCTGVWQAINTSSSLSPGSCRTMTFYGPGYVGPRVPKGSYLTVTGYADTHCAVRESSEYDNSFTKGIRVGY